MNTDINIFCGNMPDLHLLSDHGGSWDNYLNTLYEEFLDDFVRNTPYYNSLDISISAEKIHDGKFKSFWHLITDGKGNKCEEQRVPDMRRCERINWARFIIDEFDTHDSDCRAACKSIKVFVREHKNRDRYYLWCEESNYVVILEDRKTKYHLITAYVTRKAGRDDFTRFYREYITNGKK